MLAIFAFPEPAAGAASVDCHLLWALYDILVDDLTEDVVADRQAQAQDLLKRRGTGDMMAM